MDEINNERGNKSGKKCFIITPIGKKTEGTFIKITRLIKNIRPVIEEYGFTDIKAAHEICDSGVINNQIINRIMDDDLVVVNLTGNNPNVMYELCLRHVVAKPIIHICENGTRLPFDIFNSRTIFYEDNENGMSELNRDLNQFLKVIDYKRKNKDNPIYTAMAIKREILPEKSDYQIFLLKKIIERLRGVNFCLDGNEFECLDFGKTKAMTEVIIHFEKCYKPMDDLNSAFLKLDDILREMHLEFVDEEKDGLFTYRRKYRTYDNSWGRFLPPIIMDIAKEYGVQTCVTANTFL